MSTVQLSPMLLSTSQQMKPLTVVHTWREEGEQASGAEQALD